MKNEIENIKDEIENMKNEIEKINKTIYALKMGVITQTREDIKRLFRIVNNLEEILDDLIID